MSDLFDAYGRRAWLQPGLIVTLPVTLAVVTGVLKAPAFWEAAAAALVVSGVAVLGAGLVRWRGQRSQPALWQAWGGPPTTRLLRHRGAPNPELVRRRHALLAQAVPGLILPTPQQEAADPAAADAAYETAVSALRELTRDRDRFARVAEENADYGFRRNLHGCRQYGIPLAAVGAALAGAALARDPGGWGPWTALALCFLLVVDLLLLAAWCVVVRPGFVRAAAESYAERLLGALELLVRG